MIPSKKSNNSPEIESEGNLWNTWKGFQNNDLKKNQRDKIIHNTDRTKKNNSGNEWEIQQSKKIKMK